MSSNLYRETGQKKRLSTDAKGDIIIKKDNSIYKKYMKKLSPSQHSVLNICLKYMTTDTNHFIADGETMIAFIDESGYSEDTVRKALNKLSKYHILNRCNAMLKGEYIVNPTFAIKGSEDKIWEFYQNIEYSCRGEEVPREVKYMGKK